MARIEISSVSNPYGTGELQLQGKVAMSGTLTSVTDNLNTASPLKLSTGGVQVASTLQITTNSNPYIDAEDGAGNNRFQVGRDPSSQVVNVDFASNPTGGTNMVGAIRTYTDGVSLSDVMSFRKDGNVGIGTTAPLEKLHVNGKGIFGTGTAGNSYVKIEEGSYAGRIARITFNDFDGGTGSRGGWLELGTYNGQIRYGSYNDFFIGNSTKPYRFYIKDGSDNVIISNGYVKPTDSGALLQVKGTGSTSATTSLLVQNSAGTETFRVYDSGTVSVGLGLTIGSGQSVSDGTFALNNQNLQSYNSFSIETVPQNRQIKLRPASVEVLTANYYLGANQIGVVVYDTGSYSHDSSAVLQVNSTTRGFLPPRMTTIEKNAIVTPAIGLMVFDTTLNRPCFYNGVWVTL